MATSMTSKGQVTIPKRLRDALQLKAGAAVEFSVNAAGEVVLHAARRAPRAGRRTKDRFDAVRGSAQIRWCTEEIMQLLRPED